MKAKVIILMGIFLFGSNIGNAFFSFNSFDDTKTLPVCNFSVSNDDSSEIPAEIPIIKFSEMTEGTDLSQYAHSTLLAKNPKLVIMKDKIAPFNGMNVLEMQYKISKLSSVWFENDVSNLKFHKNDEITFSIRGIANDDEVENGKPYPRNIVLRLIKKDGSYSEVVIGSSFYYNSNALFSSLVPFMPKTDVEFAEAGNMISHAWWQEVKVPLYLFISPDGKEARGMVKKFRNESEFNDVVKIAIVVRGDMNYGKELNGKFRISDIYLKNNPH